MTTQKNLSDEEIAALENAANEIEAEKEAAKKRAERAETKYGSRLNEDE